MNRIIPAINIENLILQSKTKKGTAGQRIRRRLKILERDNFQCVTCGRKDNLTIAHIIPIRRPGKRRASASTFKFDNCKTQCVECHIREEFGFL